MAFKAPFSHLRLASPFVSSRTHLDLTSRWHTTVRHAMSERIPNKDARYIQKKRISGIWYIPSPSTTDPTSIISKLPQLVSRDRQILTKALFLVSPGLAPWFEQNSDFLQKAVNWIYAPVIPEATPTSYVAVVDGLPAPEYFEEWGSKGNRPYALAEGIALCLAKNMGTKSAGADSDRVGILEIMSQTSKHERRSERKSVEEDPVVSIVTVPLANTLFVNGSPHTAFKVKWAATDDGQSLVPKYDRHPLDSVRYTIRKDPRHFLEHSVPLYPLTVARTVVSTMGNVVRELMGDDGQPLKASAELEKVVPSFLASLEQKKDLRPEIKVFARVMPPGRVDGNKPPKTESISSADASKDTPLFKRIDYGKAHSTLQDGGRFYRVTSGGGGWGKKAGLLSLDPATNFSPPKQSESSMFPDPDDIDSTFDSAAEVGALVPAGHTVQFFASVLYEPYPPYFETQPDHDFGSSELATRGFDLWSNLDSQQFIVGTQAPDDTPQPDSRASTARLAPVLVLPGRFGAMSVGGATLTIAKQITVGRIKKPEQDYSFRTFQHIPEQEFRIDAPLAMFQTHIARAKQEVGDKLKSNSQKAPNKSQPDKASTPQRSDRAASYDAFNVKKVKRTFRKYTAADPRPSRKKLKRSDSDVHKSGPDATADS